MVLHVPSTRRTSVSFVGMLQIGFLGNRSTMIRYFYVSNGKTWRTNGTTFGNRTNSACECSCTTRALLYA
ncbi:hypothetical protein Y032_0214g2315 [Ancylostoma ceylanicum]|uniref:Uncharacterized protein n=1 Tax=Ancylostoma ceylanicum TaxID=53326 RepID=A0A016SK51_9BILA|nr:hypothetical protein Y032_0214g2315 [Ancylostoma ceylanicum]